MSSMRMMLVCIQVGIYLLTTAQFALAKDAHGHETPPFAEYLLHLSVFWINFAVFVALIIVLTRKPFARVWAARRERLSHELTAGHRALAAAEEQLSRAREQLNTLPEELRRLESDLEAEIRSETQRLVNEAGIRAQKIKDQANQSAAAEQRAARTEFKEKLIALALEKARKQMKEKLSPELDARIRQRAVDALPVVTSLN